MPSGVYDHSTRRNTIERLMKKRISKNVFTDCWIWTGTLSHHGYGMVSWHGKTMKAMKLFYEELRGSRPEGTELDHLCRRRDCVNPWHLDPVTHQVNCIRGVKARPKKTHCSEGHPYDTVVNNKGKQFQRCSICHNINQKKAWHFSGGAQKQRDRRASTA